MKIQITLDIEPAEIPLANEIIATLRYEALSTTSCLQLSAWCTRQMSVETMHASARSDWSPYQCDTPNVMRAIRYTDEHANFCQLPSKD